MAMNPMKRRVRNSFLIGFLCALIIMALIVMLLLYKMQDLKQNYQKLESQQKEVYVADEYIQSGAEVTISSFKREKVQTSISDNEMVRPADFQQENEDGSITDKTIVAVSNIPKGTIITKELLEEIENKTTNDQRLQEYNMIVLPTKLAADDYIDIRIQFPTGEDYIVVSKKKVVETDEKTIWMNMNEDEILMLGNAIVEAYTTEGCKLYATTYIKAGLQEAAVPTYVVSKEVMSIIGTNPNIRSEARDGLYARYHDQEQVQVRERIDKTLSPYIGSQNSAVESGLQQELVTREEGRREFVEMLQ